MWSRRKQDADSRGERETQRTNKRSRNGNKLAQKEKYSIHLMLWQKLGACLWRWKAKWWESSKSIQRIKGRLFRIKRTSSTLGERSKALSSISRKPARKEARMCPSRFSSSSWMIQWIAIDFLLMHCQEQNKEKNSMKEAQSNVRFQIRKIKNSKSPENSSKGNSMWRKPKSFLDIQHFDFF